MLGAPALEVGNTAEKITGGKAMFKRKTVITAITVVMTLIIFFSGFTPPAQASAGKDNAGKQLNLAADYLLKKEKPTASLSPWSYIALAVAGRDLKTTLVDQACKKMLAVATSSGEMNDYVLLLLTVLAAGNSPNNYEGLDLVKKIQGAQLASGKFADNILSGGEHLVNAHIWAILALRATGADIPEKNKALDWLLAQQHTDGSFFWNVKGKDISDVDTTGMALMALGALGLNQVNPAVQKAVTYLQKAQKEDGGFESWMGESAESCSMVIGGLTAVGINPLQGHFNKPGGDLLTALLRFQLADGSFEHISGTGGNEMATQQALLALSNIFYGQPFYERLKSNTSSITKREVRFGVGNTYYTVITEGKQEVRQADAAAFIEKGRVYVPVRYLARALGVTDDGIGWDEQLQAVKLTLGNIALTLIIGDETGYVNGRAEVMGVAPMVVNGRTYLPARFVAESFNYQVDWNGASQTVIIKN